MAGDSEWWRRYWAINCRPNLTIAMVRFPDGFLSGVKGNHMSDFTLSAGCGARGGRAAILCHFTDWDLRVAKVISQGGVVRGMPSELKLIVELGRKSCHSDEPIKSLRATHKGKKMRGGGLFFIRHKTARIKSNRGKQSGNLALKKDSNVWD